MRTRRVAQTLAAQTVLGNTQVELGLVSSAWGLGMVANDGRTDPLFGRADFGDRTLRLRATHMPQQDGPSPKTTWLTTADKRGFTADGLGGSISKICSFTASAVSPSNGLLPDRSR